MDTIAKLIGYLETYPIQISGVLLILWAFINKDVSSTIFSKIGTVLKGLVGWTTDSKKGSVDYEEYRRTVFDAYCVVLDALVGHGADENVINYCQTQVLPCITHIEKQHEEPHKVDS